MTRVAVATLVWSMNDTGKHTDSERRDRDSKLIRFEVVLNTLCFAVRRSKAYHHRVHRHQVQILMPDSGHPVRM
jgi:hypothetical protein